MKFLAHKALFASLALAAPMMVGGQAQAQARSVAVVDVEGAIVKSAAYAGAMTAMETTYKQQLDQIDARRTVLNAELKPLVDAYNVAIKVPNATQQSVQPAATALQNKQAAIQQEIGRMSQPIQLARAYVVEQIAGQVDAAVRAAMRARNVDLAVGPGAAVLALGNADLTPVVVTELNRLVPRVQVQPPAGWQPGQQQPAAPQQPQPQGR